MSSPWLGHCAPSQARPTNITLAPCGYRRAAVGLRDMIISSCFPLVTSEVINIAARINGSRVRNHHWPLMFGYWQFIKWFLPVEAWEYILITDSGSDLSPIWHQATTYTSAGSSLTSPLKHTSMMFRNFSIKRKYSTTFTKVWIRCVNDTSSPFY